MQPRTLLNERRSSSSNVSSEPIHPSAPMIGGARAPKSPARPRWIPLVGLTITLVLAGLGACTTDADTLFYEDTSSIGSAGPSGGGGGIGGSTGASGPVCGDLLCQTGETPETCLQDCPPECGDGACNGGETTASCPADCPLCGDGVCNGKETPDTCPSDCPPTCGDGACDGNETPDTCAKDCPPVCGDGVCNGGETLETCAQDCSVPACAHPVCEAGPALMRGCDPCVDMVCAQDPFCCSDNWDGQCVGEATSICGAGCCGDGTCSGEDCNSCPQDCGGACVCGDGACEGEDCSSCEQDCGVCIPDPTCPHSVCFVAGPLDPMVCFDPCVSQVCAMQPSCCEGSPPAWGGECTVLAHMLCGANTCITDVCNQDPTCCTSDWTQGCVDIAKMACNTQCDCAHSICSDNGGPLNAMCNPCVTSICSIDPYCCDANWDNACVNEVEKICGINCN
jgi:hypothetical protein